MLYKMVLVSDVLGHIGRIYSPLNLANMKIQKLKFVRNTTSDNQGVLNFMLNPDWRIFLFSVIALKFKICQVRPRPLAPMLVQLITGVG